MQNCPQTDTQSVYQHGLSVRDHLLQLVNVLQTGQLQGEWKLPDWLFEFKDHILNSLLPIDILEEYTTYHDVGKPYCIEYDDHGKRHFPNHAEKSYQVWIQAGGNIQVAKLIKMDIDIHCLKQDKLDEFCQRPEAISLLMTGLAEINSNAKMFGGLESVSFKIKYKRLDKMGKRICQKLFRSSYVVDL